MSENIQTPVSDLPPVETQANDPSVDSSVPAQPKASPAQDLRNIQHLLLGGIFPGNVAPSVVQAYQLLEKMSLEIENGTK